MQQQNVMIFW